MKPPSGGRQHPLPYRHSLTRDQMVISCEVVKQLVDLEPLVPPKVVRGLSGRRIAFIEYQTAPLKLLLAGNHGEEIQFLVIDCPLSPLVLGFPWLQLHNPHVNWVNGEITPWDTRCFLRCLGSAATPEPTKVLETQSLEQSQIPEEYRDLAPVFSKEQAVSLPPHRPYDLAIDLKPCLRFAQATLLLRSMLLLRRINTLCPSSALRSFPFMELPSSQNWICAMHIIWCASG